MKLNQNITLAGDLDNYSLEGNEIAMNNLYDRINQQGVMFLGRLECDAKIGSEEGLRHWTDKGCSIFFRAGNATGHWTMTVYAYGRHVNDNNKQYKLYTFEKGNKTRLYTFEPRSYR